MHILRAIYMVCKDHDVAMRCSRVNNVHATPHIVSGEVKLKELVGVYRVFYKKYQVAHISVGAIGGC
jgi:hypothetical protein